MSDLKPCPFCGGEAKGARAAKSYHIYCEQCGSDVMSSTLDCMTTCQIEKQRLRAISKWNTRPLEEAKDARIAELEEKIERLTNFCTSAIYKDESDAPEVWELNLIELLAKGGE